MKLAFSLQNKRIWVAGHNGMVGRALVKALESQSCEILTASKSELDLRSQGDVYNWLQQQKPDAIFLAAARVGGIGANSEYPAEFIYDNLAIQTNVIHAAYQAGVDKLLFLGSSCIYPRQTEYPIRESELFAAPLEPTNEAYAVAKIAGLKMCQAYRRQYGCDFISAMPCNLYGSFDSYHLENSHVIPAMIMKFDAAIREDRPEVVLWGSGKPLREFLYVDDLADGLLYLMQHYSDFEPVNVGTGIEISIYDLAQKIAAVTGYEGRVEFDDRKPDGTMRKVLDVSKMTSLGWRATTDFDYGLVSAYEWYKKNIVVKNAA